MTVITRYSRTLPKTVLLWSSVIVILAVLAVAAVFGVRAYRRLKGTLKGTMPATTAAPTVTPSPPPARSVLEQTDTLSTADATTYLRTPDDKYTLVLQQYGVLRGYSTVPPTITWGSSTTAPHGAAPYRLVMQSDGDLVIMDTTNKLIWSSGTSGKGTAPYRLVLQGTTATVQSASGPVWCVNLAAGTGNVC